MRYLKNIFIKICEGNNLQVISPVLLKRAIRFASTGIFVTGVHMVIAITSVRYLMLWPPIANGVAFICATFLSYFINTVWSFSAKMDGKTLLKFISVSIICFFLTMFIAWIIEKIGLDYLIGISAVALLIPPLTFILHNLWTYR